MNQPVILFLVVIIAVLFIIWWWNRRSDDRPPDESYHANPFKGTPTYEPTHTAAETHAAEHHEPPVHEVAETPPATTDPVVIAPDLVLGDESPITPVPVQEEPEPMVADTPAAPPSASEPAPAASDAVVVTPDISLGDEAPLAAVPPTPAEPSAPVVEPVPVVEAVEPVTPVAPTPIELTPPAEPTPPPVPAAEAPAEPAKAPAAEIKSDDLTIIEGIGPKINSVLQQAGIRTYADLAAAKPAAIREILTAAKLHTADPATWPQQAKLAAAGKWEQLKTLQDKLDGGRKA